MKSFNQWREEKEASLQENFTLGLAQRNALGVANTFSDLGEGKKKKKMFGDEEVEDDGGELATAAEPKDEPDDEEDDDDACGGDDLSPSMQKKCGKMQKKKMKAEGCGKDKDVDVDEEEPDEDDEIMMQKKKQLKKSKKEGYNPNETPAEFLASVTGQMRGPQLRNHDGVSEYLEDAVYPAEDGNKGLKDPNAGQVGFSPFTKIGELGGNFESQWEEIRDLAFGVRDDYTGEN